MRDAPHQTVFYLDFLIIQRFDYLGSSGCELHSVQKTLRNILLPYLRSSAISTSFCHISNVFLPHLSQSLSFFLQYRSHARAFSHAIDIIYRPYIYKNLPIINYNKNILNLHTSGKPLKYR
jgi:hypothetical protein